LDRVRVNPAPPAPINTTRTEQKRDGGKTTKKKDRKERKREKEMEGGRRKQGKIVLRRGQES